MTTAKQALLMHCTVHGSSTTRAPCQLASDARAAWKKATKRGRENPVIAVVMMSEPAHGAVCALDGNEEHVRMMYRCLKSTIRSAKIAKTKAEKHEQTAQHQAPSTEARRRLQ